MVGIVVPLYDEAYEIIRGFSFVKAQGYRHYHGKIFETPCSLFLAKPQISERAAFRRWLQAHDFSNVILSGYAGAVRQEFSLGQAFLIQQAKSAQKPPLFAEGSATHTEAALLQVPYPVFARQEKEAIAKQESVVLIDMESYIFLQEFYRLQNDKKISAFIKPYILKIVGDKYNDEKIMRQEFYFRAFFREKKINSKIKIVFKSGVFSSIRLYRRKRFLQKKLKKEVYRLVQAL